MIILSGAHSEHAISTSQGTLFSSAFIFYQPSSTRLGSGYLILDWRERKVFGMLKLGAGGSAVQTQFEPLNQVHKFCEPAPEPQVWFKKFAEPHLKAEPKVRCRFKPGSVGLWTGPRHQWLSRLASLGKAMRPLGPSTSFRIHGRLQFPNSRSAATHPAAMDTQNVGDALTCIWVEVP